ncbi:2-(1,2-epoxy-1,2-dihydrophenyl)acetyl-CoA isomerase [Virgibacillus natechei]|uniref:2-(1,2-epoxy-1,2-dihydrophenyl)acetyl-CoA isomerase n=1 Tax=Virgibacillus natechei TaxID=1216297 RepID=A0ABS4IJY1_9BACI|nr:enoyl-CoA hydratase [Virgibacillus natechei]MBP1971275.1 2-(1,2-epoxy-1,2-dihydrophenyl)acetyl-CoA isomerase [Virgibacillus natechei]UZD12098.1 enoyl-CoA hydratase [Virgibacillus natechei]
MENVATENLLVDINEGIMHLTLNRPDSLNAFSPEMITGLKQAINQAKLEEEIRVVILSGAGRTFSAGGDLKTMGKKEPIEVYEHLGELNELIRSMRDLEKPIIAAVHGFAAGAGFNLALACDMILAAEDSKFVLSFSQVGLISDGGGLFFLPRLIGPYRAKELLFSAEPIKVDEAHKLGIVNHVFPLEEFEEKVSAFAAKIASGPSVAYGFIKKIADQSLVSSLDEILEQERITQATVINTEDHQEGVQAFFEKRKPNFKKG